MNPVVLFLFVYLVIVMAIDSHYKFSVDVQVLAGVRQDPLIKFTNSWTSSVNAAVSTLVPFVQCWFNVGPRFIIRGHTS